MDISLPHLPYAYDALEPHISRVTLEFHHTQLRQEPFSSSRIQ